MTLSLSFDDLCNYIYIYILYAPMHVLLNKYSVLNI